MVEFNFLGKLQITPLKFGGVQIYNMKSKNVWILHPDISEFGFYPLKFGSLNFTSPNSKTLGCKLQKPSNFTGLKFKHPQNLGGKIQNLKHHVVKFKHPQISESKI